MSAVQLLTVNSSLGGPIKHSGLIGQLLLEQDDFQLSLDKQQVCLQQLFPQNALSKNKCIQMLNQNISQFSYECSKQEQAFLIISGDHSSAMGSWAGVLNALQTSDQFGLLWLDAHLDAHTYGSSPTGNYHGMPVAALLGKADQPLKQLYPSSRYLAADHLKLLGVRSYEPAEFQLLKDCAVEIVFANQMDNFTQVFDFAYQSLAQTCSHIGISIDLDIIDPLEAPAVATPVGGGIQASELLAGLDRIKGDSKWCGLECTEFIPIADIDQRTLTLLIDIVQLYSSRP